MSKQKLRYLGNGPGQGEGVAIGGIRYEPHETYDFNATRAADLLHRGGWEVVKPIKRNPGRAITKRKRSESWPKH